VRAEQSKKTSDFLDNFTQLILCFSDIYDDERRSRMRRLVGVLQFVMGHDKST
jgi:hypothetical protein